MSMVDYTSELQGSHRLVKEVSVNKYEPIEVCIQNS